MEKKRGRPRNPETDYRVWMHRIGKYKYAATHRTTHDAATGKSSRKMLHWGSVDSDMKFHPNAAYLLLSPEERNKFIFPGDWDISEAEQQS